MVEDATHAGYFIHLKLRRFYLCIIYMLSRPRSRHIDESMGYKAVQNSKTRSQGIKRLGAITINQYNKNGYSRHSESRYTFVNTLTQRKKKKKRAAFVRCFVVDHVYVEMHCAVSFMKAMLR